MKQRQLINLSLFANYYLNFFKRI